MKADSIIRERLASSLRLTYTWRTAAAFGLLAFAVLWNGMIALFLVVGAGWPVVFHLLVGLFLIWYVAALLVNKSVIEASGRELRVSHGPIPTWTRNRTIPVADLRQLFLARSGSQKTGNTNVPLWTLKAELANGKALTLLNPVRDRELVERIEQDLEAYYHIRDIPREETLDLPDLSRVKEILPAGLQRHLERAEATARTGHRPPVFGRPSVPTPPAFVPHGRFHLYQAQPGETFCVLRHTCRVVANREIRWQDTHHPSAHVITASGAEAYRQFYAELIRQRWTYFEERPLDADERETLGFTDGASHPYSLRNGQDRYYPGNLQVGAFLADQQAGERVEQYTYLTTRSSTQFRAFRVGGGKWEVCVQEPVDSGAFDRC